jgi:aspartate racemase
VLTPDAADRAEVHRVSYEELVVGVVRDESRQAYRSVIRRLVERGAEGIILGCTEIELLAEMPGTSQGFTGRDIGESHVTSTV